MFCQYFFQNAISFLTILTKIDKIKKLPEWSFTAALEINSLQIRME